jgi:uncharacterized membrane protein
VAWAQSVIAANPGAEVIVVTHAYIATDSTRVSLCDDINAQAYNVGADNDGESLWKKFVSQSSQISLILNGHFTDSSGQGVGRRIDLGVNGNIINQILSDYQDLANGGNGYLRILTFHPSLNTIDVKTYSPTLNAYFTDSANQFTVQWHSTGSPQSGAGTVGGLVRTVSCSTISGATISANGTSTSSNSNGNFNLNLTAPAAYSVTAAANGYFSVLDSLNVWVGYPALVKYYLSTQQPGSISGTVTNTSGAGISNATVWYSGGTTKTDSNGNYSFSNVPVGSYTVTGSQVGYQSASNQNLSVTSGSNAVSNLVLTATSSGTISGIVTNMSGAAIVGAIISYSGGSTTATTNSAGSYTLAVAPGTYSVTASASGFLASTQPNVSVTSNSTTTVNFALAQSGTISGTVTNSAGTGLANATVSYSGGSATATTNSGGAYTLSVAPGTYSVTASATGYQSSTQSNVIVSIGATTTANFSLVQLIGTISGTVTNSAGAAISGATVSYSGGSPTATTNAAGSYALSVPPGTYSVTATATGYQSTNQSNVTVTNGNTTTVNFTLVQSVGTAMSTVQAAVKFQSGQTSLSLAYPLTPTAGNTLIVVGISSGLTGTTLTVSDNNHQTWQSAYGYVTNPNSNGQVMVWFVSNCVAQPTTVTLSIGSTAHNIHMQIFEMSGLASAPVDAIGSADSSSSSVTTQTVTTTGAVTQGQEYNLAATWTWNCSTCAPTITKDPNYTILLQSPNPTGGDFVLSQARIQNAASGTQSATFSSSIAYEYATVLVTFKGAATSSNGAISGTVTDAKTGAGIANATVSYSGGSTTANTNSTGAYTLSVAPGSYSVTATAANYQSSTETGVAVSSGSSTTANFSLTQNVGTIAGTVTSSTGAPIANATVSYSGGSTTATTNSSGAYTLNVAPGTYTVTVSATGYQTSTQPNVTVTQGTTTTTNFSLTLTTGTISGTVSSSTGTAISGATVSYSGGSTTASTNSSGAYTLSVAPGTYSVTAAATGYQSSTQSSVTVTAGSTTSTNFSLTATPGTISGTVTSSTGTTISGATVSYSGGSATAITNASGAYSLSAAPGTYSVTVTATGYQSSTQSGVAVTTGNTTTVNFSLVQSAGTISGTVTGSTGTAISGATVSYSGGSATATTNAVGAYSLNVAPGTYGVTAAAAGYQSSTVANVTVTVGNTTTTNFSLTQLTGTISGTVTSSTGAAIAGATISYSGGSATATTSSSGNYSLVVAPGTYSATASDTGYQSSTQPGVTVAANTTTTINFSLAQAVGSTISTVQAVDKFALGQTSLSLAYPVTPTAGNTLIVVGISSGLSGTTLAVSDNNHQTWQSALAYVTNPNSNGQIKVWYVSNCPALPTTVTVSIGSTAHNIHMQVFEVSGLIANPVDAAGTADSGSNPVTTQTATTTTAVSQAQEYSLATSWTWNCSTCTPTIAGDPNYAILLQSPDKTGGDFVLTKARMQTLASGKQSVTFTSSSNYRYATVLITFK